MNVNGEKIPQALRSKAQWVAWRDSECQDVAPFETGMGAKGGDPRLSCIIDYNAQRVASLKARYP